MLRTPGLNAATANAFINNYEGNIPVAEYAIDFRQAYRYGEIGIPSSVMSSSEYTSSLSEAQKKLAYDLGKTDAKYRIDKKQEKIDSIKAINAGKDSGKASKKGKVYFDGSTVGKSLTERQKASLKGLRLVAEATGVDIHIFESKVGKDGKRQGANGWYDPAKKEIYLDLHAGVDGNGVMLFTASHELTHHIREVAPAKFRIFADALLEEYTKNGVSLDELISRKLETLEANGRLEGMTEDQAYDFAYEEVIADSCEAMLVDSDAIEALSKKLQAKDKSLWETIKDFIAKLVAKIKAAYEGLDPDSAEGQLVREMKDSAERLQKLWVDALLEASEVGTSVDVEAQVDNSAKYMDRKVDNNAKKRYNKRLIRDEFATNAMIWAFSGKTKPGDVKVLYNPRDNTWNKLVADNTEERYGILLSVEDTSQNAEAIRNLYNEVYNEDNGEQQGIDEGIREDYERYWSLSDNSGDDNFDVGKQSADGHARELYGSKPQSNRDSDFRQGPRDSEKVKYSDRRAEVSELSKELEKQNIDSASVISFADSYFDRYGGTLNKSEMRYDFLHALQTMAEKSDDAYERAYEEIASLADELVYNPKNLGSVAEDFREMKNYIRGIKFKVNNRDKAEFDIYGGFGRFRKEHMGKLTLANNGISIDSVYMELQGLYGMSYFPDVNTVAEQLMVIADIVDTPLSSVADIDYDLDEASNYTAAEIVGKYADIISESWKKAQSSKAENDTKYINYRNPDSYSNRSLLAGALETAVQNDIEREKLRQYKSKIDLINSEEQKLHDLREQIKELSFKKGPRDTEAIKKLQLEATKAANRINTYDRQLLNLESTKALKGVLDREKAQARKRDAQKYKEAIERYREKSAKTQRELMERYQESRKRGALNRNKTAMRHKIKDVVNELNSYLLKGTKDKHVPIELQKAVAEALDAVNMDTVGAEERIAKLKSEMMRAKTPEAVQDIAKKIEHIEEMGGNMAKYINRRLIIDKSKLFIQHKIFLYF